MLVAFFPDVNVESLTLPGGSCAMAHQVSKADRLYLNSDGTTKNQRKVNATAFNGVVISVNEVPDGKADTIIADIDSQLKKLRSFAENEMLNWSIIIQERNFKEQVKLRKKLLMQKTSITLTSNGRKCSLSILIEEVKS